MVRRRPQNQILVLLSPIFRSIYFISATRDGAALGLMTPIIFFPFIPIILSEYSIIMLWNFNFTKIRKIFDEMSLNEEKAKTHPPTFSLISFFWYASTITNSWSNCHFTRFSILFLFAYMGWEERFNSTILLFPHLIIVKEQKRKKNHYMVVKCVITCSSRGHKCPEAGMWNVVKAEPEGTHL